MIGLPLATDERTPYRAVIHIPMLPPHVAKKRRVTKLPLLQADKFRDVHARNSYRKLWAEHTVLGQAKSCHSPSSPLKKANILGIRYSVGKPPDRINVWSSFKPIVDALQAPTWIPGKMGKRGRWSIGCSIIENDSPEVLVEEEYRSVRVPHLTEQRIEIHITEVLDPFD